MRFFVTKEAWNFCILLLDIGYRGLPCSSNGKESACNSGDQGLIPRLGRSPREENGNPLQYPCLENPMDGGAWGATVCGVAKSWTQLSDLHYTIGYRANMDTKRKI